MATKYIPILDGGHGGMIDGVYQTPGKRSPKWSRGVLYEGMFNRWVVNRVIEKLDRNNIPYYHVSPELRDTSLPTRCSRANNIYRNKRNTYLFSIHANAGGGKGVEGFTTKGKTKSDAIGEIFLRNIEKRLDEQKMRFDYSDGDRDKEANFYVLRKFIGPAFLLESGFMDNSKDYHNLWDEQYLETLVNAIVEVMVHLYRNGI